jgi:hypothetical protein
MEKSKTINKHISLILEDDVLKDEAFKAKIQQLDNKVQQMLLWSTICSVWSYLVLIVVIARIYASFHGKHPALLIGSLVFMYILMGTLIWFAWKSMTYKRSNFYAASKSHLKYQVSKLCGQRKLVSYYLLEYGLLLGISSMFFFADFQHGLSLLLKLTAPVSILTYVIGIYFIVNFTRQMKKLELIERQLNHISMANINKN